MKKIITVVLLCVILVGCNSHYKVDKDSELTKEDMKILQMKYEDMTTEQRRRVSSMHHYMTVEEIEKFEEDLIRVVKEEYEAKGYPAESMVDVKKNSFDYRKRELRGELTDEEIQEKKDRAELRKENELRASSIKVQTQKEMDKINKRYQKVEAITATESTSTSVKVRVDVKPMTDIAVGEIYNIRMEIAHAAVEIIDHDWAAVDVELYLGKDYKDTYTYRDGKWNKDVRP